MIKAILFDLDGVLVDACDWHYRALNDALKSNGFDQINYEDHLEKYNGLPTFRKLDMLGLSKEDANLVWKSKQEKTLETIKKYGYIDKYKQKMLKSLKNKGYKIACVTNSIKETASEMLKITGQYEYIDILITNEDVVLNKPHPDCYYLAFEKLGLDKKECLIIEDSEKGIEAAVKSGANLQKVNDVYDVTLDLIKRRINEDIDTDGR